jgi:hypothetical protein
VKKEKELKERTMKREREREREREEFSTGGLGGWSGHVTFGDVTKARACDFSRLFRRVKKTLEDL